MEDVQAPYCHSSDSLRLAEDLVSKIFFGQELLCRRCLPQCDSLQYTTNIDSKYYPNEVNTTLTIYYEYFSYISINEYWSYDVTSLFSDVGGTLCFFMGMSFVTMAEIMASIVFTVKKTVSRKQSAKPALETN